MRSMEVARRCCRGVGGSPLPRRGALPTPGGALSHPDDRAPPTLAAMALLIPIPHRRRRAKPVTSGVGGSGARAPPLATGSDPDG